MRIFLTFLTLFILVFFSFAQAQSSSPFINVREVEQKLNFKKYYSIKSKNKIKIAVLDKGFDGYEKEIGKTLPDNTTYHAGPLAAPDDAKTAHGLAMAQILTAFMTDEGRASSLAPELHLYNVFGFTNFKAAIDDLIKSDVDLVLYSEVWEFGSNWDGRGFINAEVDRAANAGIVWVNAAGNFGDRTYNSDIKTLDDDWVKLPDQNNALAIRCAFPKSSNGNNSSTINASNSSSDNDKDKDKKCQLRVVLSWNDFKDDSALGTEKDLDLALTDDLLNVVQSSSLKQTGEKGDAPAGASKYPREIITAEVKEGQYFIRVKNRSHNFSKGDQLRITVDGDNVTMPSHSKDESLLNPADNKNIVTVGASDSERSSYSKSLHKPDIMAPSSIKVSNKEEYRGTSNAAAIVAAGFGILLTQEGALTKKQLLKISTRDGYDSGVGGNAGASGMGGPGQGLSVNDLWFTFTGHGCFIPVTLTNAPQYVKQVIDDAGGVVVQTTQGYRIMIDFDPIQLDSNMQRVLPNDMITTTPSGYQSFQRARTAGLPREFIEVFQHPREAGVCTSTTPLPPNGGNGDVAGGARAPTFVMP